ncbi:MAG: CRISPR-associated ring nuclease Csm6 [Parahaliea sp.]
MNDSNGSRKTLLCVTGLSPQVVTETLYVLAVQQGWIPDAIRIITTVEGANRARLSLLSDDHAWFKRLCADYQLPPIQFDKSDILLIEDEQGRILEDIRTPADNEQAANFIAEQVRQLTADPTGQLHVSIAGGRKTMGFYLGYALSLFGRSQDVLSHVLVSGPYESCWDFFYPTPYNRVIQTQDKSLVDCCEAEVCLAEIPFVRLRHGMDAQLLEGEITFAQAVAALKQSLTPPRLVLDLQSQRVEAADKVISLTPASLALLSVFARRVLAEEPPLPAPNKEVADQNWAERYLREYRLIKGGMADIDNVVQALSEGMDGNYFSQRLSRLHSELKKSLGSTLAQAYRIDDGSTRPRRYRLALSAQSIRYESLTAPQACEAPCCRQQRE